MTAKDALDKWSEGCTAAQAGANVVIRDGNWQPLERVLRHDAQAQIVEVGSLNGDTLLKVTPAAVKDAPAGKKPQNRPPYLLIVK